MSSIINDISMFIINSSSIIIIILLYIRMCLLGDTLISIPPNLLSLYDTSILSYSLPITII